MSVIEGYGFDFALRAPIAYIRDEEGVCPVLVADLESLHKESGPGALETPGAAESPAPNRLERNTTDATEPSTRPADATATRADPQAEPQARLMPRLAARLRRPVRREPRSSRPDDRHEDRSGPDGHPGTVVTDTRAGGVPDGTSPVSITDPAELFASLVDGDTPWQDRALCAEVGPGTFFPRAMRAAEPG